MRTLVGSTGAFAQTDRGTIPGTVTDPSGAVIGNAPLELVNTQTGSLFVGALSQERLVRLTIENNRVTGEEHLLADRGQRIRDVRQGPDGALYVVTDTTAGELWKIAPRR